jgi:cell division control protein 7
MAAQVDTPLLPDTEIRQAEAAALAVEKEEGLDPAEEHAPEPTRAEELEATPAEALTPAQSDLLEPAPDPTQEEACVPQAQPEQVSQPVPELQEKTATRPSTASTKTSRRSAERRSRTVEDVRREIQEFYRSFAGLSDKFEVIDKIGEGTFSSVYKAIDLHHGRYVNDYWSTADESSASESRCSPEKKSYVAIKRIYVTSSPWRILNELKILSMLKGCTTIAPLITAMRHKDQVLAVLPYFSHTDFREFYQTASIPGIQVYFRQLFDALSFVHAHHIIHRDIKPQNFLYNVHTRRGMLVDFGLAETEPDRATRKCACRTWVPGVPLKLPPKPLGGHPKNDARPGRRSNRAGTRGFRAPEVLLKCPDQTTKIDTWSAGVLLLCFLSKRFPFFNSNDDIEALVELATVFGRRKLEECAALHGVVFETTIPTIKDAPVQLEKLIEWCLAAYKPHAALAHEARRQRFLRLGTSSSSGASDRANYALTDDELRAIRFLSALLDVNPHTRLSAQQAQRHQFLRGVELPPLS